MNEPITLNLTLKELQQIDKYVEINDDTLSVLAKIKDAYPPQKMTLETVGEFSLVCYDGNVYYRLKYPTVVIWYKKSMVGRLEPIQDIKTKNELESVWLMNDVKYQKVEEPQSFYDKLWELISTKVGNNTDADELTDRIMDLIKDHNPEPTDAEIGEWGDSTFLPSLSGTEKLSFPITDKDLRIIVRAALAHWK